MSQELKIYTRHTVQFGVAAAALQKYTVAGFTQSRPLAYTYKMIAPFG